MTEKEVRVLPLATSGFAIEITKDSIGGTARLLFDGKRACGVCEFSGMGDCKKALAKFLRRLAKDIEAA